MKGIPISLLVDRHKIHHENVLSFGVHSTKFDLKGWKSTSANGQIRLTKACVS